MSETTAAVLYDGMPVWSVPIFWVALVIVVLSLISLITLTVRAQRQYHREHRYTDENDPAAREADYLWVFVVPALDEEVTISDSVGRLSKVSVTHRRILVVDDGSEDDTGAILDRLRGELADLTVLTRVKPNAQQGKSEALNDAWRYLHRVVLGSGEYAGWDPRRVIVTIVDADGRLDETAGDVAHHFDDERVGGVQAQVRIYNRDSFLTWAQDLEFGIFGSVFQMGRVTWGTANMGGNGQFNRLAALDAVAVTDESGRSGPWAAGRLTEDQDIGLRFIEHGWRGAQASSVVINQQGLHSVRDLYRQRTRWSQGGWQVLDRIPASARNSHLSFAARLDQFWYLITPVVQVWMGLSVALSVVFLLTGTVRPGWNIAGIVIFYVFTAGPGILGVLLARRRRGIIPVISDIVLAHAYLFYSWMIYPVVYRSMFRALARRGGWAKTRRESITPSGAGTIEA